MTVPADFFTTLEAKPNKKEKREYAKMTLAGLSDEDKKAILSLGKPSPVVVDFVWQVIALCISISLVIIVIALAIGIFVATPDPTKTVAQGSTLLTIATTILGFIGGLLAPSPVSEK